MFTVDESGKITVSLGGVCSLACRHCYITSRDFTHESPRSVREVVAEVSRYGGSLKCICVSGDTDPFLTPDATIELLTALARDHPSVPIMFTTRLVPTASIFSTIEQLATLCSQRRQLFISCISLVSFSFPNPIERADRVPPSADRLEFIRRLVGNGIPCIATLRPTFPFSIVGPDEVTALIDALPSGTSSVLGEVFLIDASRQIPRRIGWNDFEASIAATAPLTFLPQQALWGKCYLSEEVTFARSTCLSRRLPYFLRSMSAVKYLHERWSFAERRIEHPIPMRDTEDHIGIYP